MGDQAEEYVARVKAMVLGHLRGRDATGYLFGSRASATARRASDIDVAVEAPEPLPPGVLGTLRERLEESTISYRADIVDLGEVSPEFRARVRREGIRWSP